MLIFATCFEMHKKYDGLMDKGMDTQVGKCVIKQIYQNVNHRV